MQSADDDTTAPLRPTEFNLQARQLKSTKTGDAERFTVGAAAAIAAENAPAQRYGGDDCGLQKVEREWSSVLSIQHGPHELASLRRDILFGAQFLASQDCVALVIIFLPSSRPQKNPRQAISALFPSLLDPVST
ncbi:hypothetical protein AAWM_09927 [Aspergillus awamori]|uniref:Uncharacterized protein n=1 Tax=Aspergillus awamori TaxID=105351 RepID=A0A401L697_ASPAW|nr:hypothetical protein AAWM_09927 [Aspergillus awamori]